MKQKSILAIAAFSFAAFTCESSTAAVFQWDGDTGTPTAQDGGGTWNAANTNWINATNVAWANANSATFGAGVDGTYAVGVELSPTATSVVFNNSGYTLSAPSPQTVTVTNATSTIVVASGKTATLGANITLATSTASQNTVLSGGGTLIVESGGTLREVGNASTNILSINASTVEVKPGGTVSTLFISGNGSALFVNGNLNVTGGTVTVEGTMGLGQSTGTTAGILNIESGDVFAKSNNGIRIGATSGTTLGGTINLNGGTLSAYKIWKGGGTVTTSVLNLNGGTLKPTVSGLNDFITGLARANVRDHGVTINSGTNGVAIPQALLHSNIPTDAATDGGLIKEGSATLVLSGANDYNGGTTINAGAVEFGVGSTIPASGKITINSAGCVKVSTAAVPGAVMTATSILTSGRVHTDSTGAIAYTENNSENVDLSGYPSLMLGARANAVCSGHITTSGDTYHLGGGGAYLKLSAANALTGAKNLVIGAPGATGNVVLSNSNDISGAVTITSGSLTLGDPTADGFLPNVSGIQNNILLIIEAFGSVTPPPNISGPGVLRELGVGTLTMSTANTYSGGTSVENGILTLTNPAAVGSSGVTTTGNGQLRLSGGITLANSLRCNGAGPNATDGALRSETGDNTVTDFGFSAVSGTRFSVAAGSSLAIPNNFAAGNISNVRVIGSGTFILGGDNSAAMDSAHTFYLGNGGSAGPKIKAGHDAAFGGEIISFEINSNSTLQSADATARTFTDAVNFKASHSTLGAPSTGDLTFAGGAITLVADVAVVGVNDVNLTIGNNRTTFTGAVGQSGTCKLTKTGAGTLELAGSTSLTGPITVSNGTLLANASVTSTNGVVVSAAATLGGGGSVSSDITVNTDGILAPGNSAGTLAVTGSVTLGGSLAIQLDGSANDRLDVTGALDITTATLDVTTLAGGATQPSYIIATFGSLTGSAFANTNIPSGYTVEYDLTNKQIKLVSGAPSSAFTTWINANYPSLSDKTATGDPDNDGKSNLLEYAFGTDPSVSTAGSIAYVAGGNVTTPGQPVAIDFDAGSGLDFHAVFGRRKDYLTAGLTYTVQFTARLDEWVNSTATPALVSGVASPGDIAAVSIPFPATITTTHGVETPTFFRVAVSEIP